MKKIFVIAELVFVVGVMAYFLLSGPKALAPSGFVIDDKFNFEFKNANKIIISTTPEFENPIVLAEDFQINLPPGTYYWKVKGLFRESSVKNFTVVARAELGLQEKNESYRISNKGNVDLNVTEKSQAKITGNIIINVGEIIDIEKKNQTEFEGGQK